VELQNPVLSTHADAWKNTPEGKANTSLIEVLQAVLPSKTLVDDETNEEYTQHVSFRPSTRDDVIALQMKLDQHLQHRQARDTGICPVREELYAQCLDELIRQVTIESPERGLLLLRVRDEARMSIAAYQTLYQAAIAFGLRKGLQCEEGNAELQARILELEATKRALKTQEQDLKGLYEATERAHAEIHNQESRERQNEIDFLTHQSQHLESFIKSAQHN
jgi:dynein light intermediate chain